MVQLSMLQLCHPNEQENKHGYSKQNNHIVMQVYQPSFMGKKQEWWKSKRGPTRVYQSIMAIISMQAKNHSWAGARLQWNGHGTKLQHDDHMKWKLRESSQNHVKLPIQAIKCKCDWSSIKSCVKGNMRGWMACLKSWRKHASCAAKYQQIPRKIQKYMDTNQYKIPQD